MTWCAASDCTTASEHRHCPSCGLVTMGTAEICVHHSAVYGDQWAQGNRIMADFIHRGIVPARLALVDRADEMIG